MENLTLGQIAADIAIIGTLLGVFGVLFKIYRKIDNSEKLAKVNIKATKVMLDHFIEDKIGNGEFKQARKEIDEVLIEEAS